jgi:transcriptional regulator NrdR family protein
MKIALKRRRFQCVEEIKKNVTAEANEIPSEVLGDCFLKLLKNLKVVSQLRGIAMKEN